MKKTNKILIASLCLACTLLFTSFFSNFINSSKQISIDVEEYNKLKKFEELFRVYDVISNNYYIEPNYTKMYEGSVKGLLSSLDDPYSVYYNPEEFKKYWEDDQGEYAGIGVQIQSDFKNNICKITRVFKGSPAEEVGIQKGDILIKVADIDVSPSTIDSAINIIRGEIGTKVKLEFLRKEESISFDVERRQVHINLTESKLLENGVGLIRLHDFTGKSAEEFKSEYDELIKNGMKALIIDLRDNPGGWINNAQGIADLFIDNDVLCSLKYRSGNQEFIKTSKGKLEIPMVIMINENSASASELLSGAFQDYEIATIVGTTSFGKGIAQEIQSVGTNGAGFQYTVAEYLTPKGRSVHKIGIKPDIDIELDEKDKNTQFNLGDMSDKQLNKAYEVALSKIK